MRLNPRIALKRAPVCIAIIAIYFGAMQTPGVASVPDITISDTILTGANAGKDTVDISYIYTTDHWTLMRTFSSTGQTDPGGTVLQGGGVSGGSSASIASGIGPETIAEDEGYGYAERTVNTRQALAREMQPGTRYYQFWVQWTRPNVQGVRKTYGPINWYSI